MSDRPCLLVTGFGAFPGAPENPTERLIARLRGRAPQLFGLRLEAHVLPVRYDVYEMVVGPLLRRIEPLAVVHFGLSAEATGFTLETWAHNRIGAGRADASGALPPSSRVVASLSDRRAATLPVEALRVRLIRAGLPAVLSADAGDYLCNLVMFRTLCATAAQDCPAGFIHVPYTQEQAQRLGLGVTKPCLPEDDLVRGAQIILETVAEEVAPRRPSPTPSV